MLERLGSGFVSALMQKSHLYFFDIKGKTYSEMLCMRPAEIGISDWMSQPFLAQNPVIATTAGSQRSRQQDPSSSEGNEKKRLQAYWSFDPSSFRTRLYSTIVLQSFLVTSGFCIVRILLLISPPHDFLSDASCMHSRNSLEYISVPFAVGWMWSTSMGELRLNSKYSHIAGYGSLYIRFLKMQ